MTRRSRTSGDVVINAALQVADELGLDSLTIRAVAAAADMPPMSLYAHFKNKEELLDQMARELSRRLYGAGEHPTWQASLCASCHCMHDLLLAHPNWVPLVARPTPAPDLPARERLLRQMAAAGFAPGQALEHVTHAGLLALSLTMQELQHRDQENRSVFARRLESLRVQSNEDSFEAQSPTTRAALRAFRPLDLSAAFSAILAAFIAGIDRPGMLPEGTKLPAI